MILRSGISETISNITFRKWGGGIKGRLELFRKFICLVLRDIPYWSCTLSWSLFQVKMYGMFDTLFLLYSMHNDTSTLLVTVDRNAFPNRATFDLEPERLIQYDHNKGRCQNPIHGNFPSGGYLLGCHIKTCFLKKQNGATHSASIWG